jgi:phosphatidylglycerol:prolipoprotein diacylglycerol transferase
VLALLQFDPIVYLHLGPLRVSPHGIATAVGFVAGARLLLPATRARRIGDDVVFTMLYRAAIGALVGARLAYAINHVSDYSDNPLSVFAIWEGGISLFGGIAGGILAAAPVMRAHRLSFWSLMDAAAPGLALGIAIGRIGDLVVGDHLGRPTDFALGFRCTDADTASPCIAPTGAGVHMPALYDMVNATLLLVVLLVLRRRRRWDGFLILVAAAWYGLGRFVEDFFRVDEVVALGLSGSQLTALTLVLGSVLWWVISSRRHALSSVVPSGHDPGERPSADKPVGIPTLGRRPPD